MLCVILFHTHRYHPPSFQPNPKHHDRVVIFAHFASACCLLAKPGRSTLDPKEGYKTNTGSTSSVTLTLTRIEYWDRAGGGRNIIQETLTTNEVRNGKWTRAVQLGSK